MKVQRKHQWTKRNTGLILGFIFLVLCVLYILPHSVQAKDSAPVLLSLSLQQGNDQYDHATLTWKSKPEMRYLIYRKKVGGKYQQLDSLYAGDEITVYTDYQVPAGDDYTYTVRSLDEGLFGSGLSKCDTAGLTTLRKTPHLTCRYTNLHAILRWETVDGADGYQIYRRFEGKGYRQIAEVRGNTRTFKDIFHNTMTKSERDQYLLNDYYMDPSDSCSSYTIRAVSWESSLTKVSLSPYDRDGAFQLNTPTLISLRKNKGQKDTLTFNRVPWADFYRIKIGYRDKKGIYHWDTVASSRQMEESYLTCNVPVDPKRTYYTVIAYRTLANGQEICSGYEKNFSIANRSFQDKRILYVGDSITYGSPYKASLTRYRYSYPWRVHELTGAQYYNAAIPGATLSFSPLQIASFHRYRIITDVLPQLAVGQTPQTQIKGLLDKNTHSIDEFDVVIFCAGTNDYSDRIPLGDPDDTSVETFYGALSQFFSNIQTANRLRSKVNKPPIQVVMPDLFYSDRTTSLSARNNRFKKKNEIGLTLTDYQKALDRVRKNYKKQGLKIYRFNTQKIITKDNCPVATADNLHMTKTTYARLGNELSSYLIQHVFSQPRKSSR